MRPQAAKRTVKDTVPSSRCLLCADPGFSASLLSPAICKLYSSAVGNSLFAAFLVLSQFQIRREPISPDASGIRSVLTNKRKRPQAELRMPLHTSSRTSPGS